MALAIPYRILKKTLRPKNKYGCSGPIRLKNVKHSVDTNNKKYDYIIKFLLFILAIRAPITKEVIKFETSNMARINPK